VACAKSFLFVLRTAPIVPVMLCMQQTAMLAALAAAAAVAVAVTATAVAVSHTAPAIESTALHEDAAGASL